MNTSVDNKKTKSTSKVVKNRVAGTKKEMDVEKIPVKIEAKKSIKYTTHEGHRLTKKEAVFIDGYMEHGNQRKAVIDAGFSTKAPGQYAQELLKKPYIAKEIEYRMQLQHQQRIANGNEVMEFFTKVMNGEIKDQFGLDAPLSERIKAGQEIAKRTVDIANKVAGVTAGAGNEVTIKLDWSRN